MATEITSTELQTRMGDAVAKLVKEFQSSTLNRDDLVRDVALGVLELLSGETNHFPQMMIVPMPHKNDKAFMIDAGATQYWPENHEAKKTLKGALIGSLLTYEVDKRLNG